MMQLELGEREEHAMRIHPLPQQSSAPRCYWFALRTERRNCPNELQLP